MAFLYLVCALMSLISMQLFEFSQTLYYLILPSLPLSEMTTSQYFEPLYPVLLSLLLPLFHKQISSFYIQSTLLSWLCTLSSIILKIYFKSSTPYLVLSNILIVISLTTSISSSTTFILTYIKPSEYFKSFNLLLLSFVVPFSIKEILCLPYIGLNSILPLDQVRIFEIIFGTLGLILTILTIRKNIFSSIKSTSLLEDFKVIIKNSDDLIFYLSISAQVCITFCIIFDMYSLIYLLVKKNVKSVIFPMILFIVVTVIGGFTTQKIIRKSSIGIFAKVYMGISILLMFLLNFVFRGPIFNFFMVSVLGVTMVSSLPFLFLLSIQTQKIEGKVGSVVLVYWLGIIFFIIFCSFYRFLHEHYDIYPSRPFNFLQILVYSSLLAVYDMRIISKPRNELLFK